MLDNTSLLTLSKKVLDAWDVMHIKRFSFVRHITFLLYDKSITNKGQDKSITNKGQDKSITNRRKFIDETSDI